MRAFLGVDVQIRRKLSYYACDERGRMICSGWFTPSDDVSSIVSQIETKGCKLSGIGIDAPRLLLSQPRDWYWVGRNKRWRRRGKYDKGVGRHCEVVVSAHRLANPQWTPLVGDAPGWMHLGTKLFRRFKEFSGTYEVFPSASYRMLKGETGTTIILNVGSLEEGPKDMLDAAVAAITVREFLSGRGSSVGGGDSLGEILLPRRLDSQIAEVLTWPR